ncbi:MAG: metallophosphoesterase [Lachnospiraceae bacterium]|nr:metallophosphoesterase [Lachnospiraceae bacterium]
MWMWLIILGTTLLLAGGSLFYLISRFKKISYTEKFSHGKKGRRILLAVLPVFLIVSLSILTMDLTNMMIIVIILSIIWLLCDLIAAIVRRIRRSHGGAGVYPAGICALVLTALYFILGWFFAHQVFETDYVLYSDKVQEPLRIVLFADAHMGTTFDGEKFAKWMQKINETEPDAVVIAGDLVDDSTTYEEMRDCCRALSGLDTKYGVFYAYGNHDKGYSSGSRGYGYSELETELKDNGVVILQDAVYDLNDTCTLIGRADASVGRSNGGYETGGREEMRALLAQVSSDRYTIVLDHQPNDYANEAAAGADLVLSGHTHGGQLIPITKVGEWIGANDATYGYERRENTDFIVTSGISAWSILFKTGCKSEYVVIDILPGEG